MFNRKTTDPKDQIKVFCIGFNKTGTSSLYRFFESCDLPVIHSVLWPHETWLGDFTDRFDKITGFTDGEEPNYARLDHVYPKALFILNHRKLRPWLQSRIKHVLRRGHPSGWAETGAPKRWKTGNMQMARQFYADEAAALDLWITKRHVYHKAVRKHFAGNARFLDIDITRTPDWQDQVADLMTRGGLSFKPSDASADMIANKRDVDDVLDQDWLERYFALADERIALAEKTLGDLDAA